MWFRMSSGQSAAVEPASSTTTSPTTTATDRFEKFRVSSFKKRIRGNVGRSKSPKKIPNSPTIPHDIGKIDNNNIDSEDTVDNCNKINNSKILIATPIPDIFPLSDPKTKSKKPTLKTIKTDPPTRKFNNNKNLITKTEQESQTQTQTQLQQEDENEKHNEEEYKNSPGIEIEKEKEKERILLTDRKYKNNRIEKSSSKTKIADMEKRDSVKNRNGRKISAPPILIDGTSTNGKKLPNKSKNMRSAHSTLNLHALVKLVSSKKFLSTEDFDSIRRKSLSEVALTALTIPTYKTTTMSSPIALKGPTNGDIAKEVGNGNVILVKHDLKNSNCDDDNNISTKSNSNKSKRSSYGSSGSNGKKRDNSDEEFYSCTDSEDDILDRNVDEQQNDLLDDKKSAAVDTKDKRKSSPSLTSRVAAKITETTNNYKNRKANKIPKTPKKRKNSLVVAATTKRPEYYKQISTERLHSTSIVRQPSDRRPDVANTSVSSSVNTSHNNSELQTSQSLDADTSALDAEKDTKRDRSKSKSAPVSVNRSESYKERLSHKRNRNNRRKTSDPSLSSKANDDQSELGLSGTNYSRSSSSSLSSGGSLEFANTLESTGNNGIAIGQHGQSINLLNSGIGGPMVTAQGTISTPRQWVDSEDEEDNFTEVDWSSNVAADLLAALTDAEKKRQEIINEIYQTERSHVRTLRLLEGIFMRPLQEANVLPYDHLQLLFPPALLSLKDLHSSFEQKLKLRRIEHSHIVQNVGDLLAGMFEGQSGEELREFAAHFCARQQIALEALKEKRRKDENLQRFLTKAESHKACRRLQLKDLLPTVLQRLTKYPLLFENLYKITKRVIPNDDDEADAIQRALSSSKRILVEVNQAVKTAEDEHKLQTIQRRLDKSSFEKDASYDIKNLDLTQYKLIHDGHLTMKKNPGVQLHGLLFDSMMVLLHKQDDKYFLKNFQSTAGDIDKSKSVSPITYFDQQTLVRQSAVDKNTFFLIITKTSQMLELRAPSSSECKTWFKHISDAAEHYKPRSKNSQDIVEDPASATLPHSNTKESLESTPERITTVTATATAVSTGGNNNSTPADSIHTTNVDNNCISTNRTSGDGNSGSQLLNNNNADSGGNSNTRSRIGINESNNNDDDLIKSNEIGRTNNNDANVVRRKEEAFETSIFSNNSNNTRTLMQHSPLLEPSAIQISISPAHTAEPVLTPNERLKRLDNSIREGLAEKQKIICDMFRVPIEHFNEIVDIVGLPEAPKDSSDIVLAAYAQVQSLTEVINEYMKITPEQEISAVSTTVCDQCHKQQQHIALPITSGLRSISPIQSSIASTTTEITIIPNPDLPTKVLPSTTTSSYTTSTINRDHSLDDELIHEDDDGYCEIDELRLPSVQTNSGQTIAKSLPIGVAVEMAAKSARTTGGSGVSGTPELINRQSTISTDSIPEESEHDMMTQHDGGEHVSTASIILSKGLDDDSTSSSDSQQRSISCSAGGSGDNTDATNNAIGIDDHSKKSNNDDSLSSEHIEINDSYDTMSAINKVSSLSRNNSSCRQSPRTILCGPNRLAHCNSLEPTVPCSIINGFVSALNSQISLLLPKINERDLERERLRKENQHLRELLSAMHERQRVEDEKETPDYAKSSEKDKNNELNFVDHKTELSSVPE